MKLYYCETIASRKTCALANHVGSDAERVFLNIGTGEHKTPEFLAINPNGKLPALVDGDYSLWESTAIMAYLARKAGTDLWPSDLDRQIEVLRWLNWDAQHYSHWTGTLYFEHLIKPLFNIGPPDTALVEEATGYFRQFSAVLNDHLKGRKFLLGDKPTIADFALAVSFPYAEGAQIPLAEFPELVRFHHRMNELPGWREPFPERTEAAA